MKSEILKKKKLELLSKIADLEDKQKEYLEQDTFKLGTNTAYIQNMKVFEGWDNFIAWIQTKHNQHWEGLIESTLEVTFKVKRKKKIRNSKQKREREIKVPSGGGM